jgi:beta-mannosidase
MSLFTSQKLSTGWEFKQTDEEQPWLPVAKLPTVVHLDLMAHKMYFQYFQTLLSNHLNSDSHSRIPDTSLDMNEHAASWVGEARWSYRCQFSTHPQKEGTRTALIFEGLDTFATVKLNGIPILSSDNMFISYHIDITSHLVPVSSPSALNILKIDFDSALARGKAIQKEKEAGGEHVYNARQGGIERLGVRKAQYHWGWDWGPKYMTCGPWRPIRIETYCCHIEGLQIDYTLNNTRDNVQGFISAWIDGKMEEKVHFIVQHEKGDLVFQTEGNVGSDGSVEKPFELSSLELWYPHGYGSQPLYTLACELIVDGTVALPDKENRVPNRRVDSRT